MSYYTRSHRPTGVSVLAVLYFLGGLGLVGSALSILFLPLPSFLGSISAWVGLVALAFAILEMAIAWGLWELRDWARTTTIVLAVLDALGCLIGAALAFGGVEIPFLGRLNFPGIGLGYLVLAAIQGLIIYYLTLPEIAAAFGRGREPSLLPVPGPYFEKTRPISRETSPAPSISPEGARSVSPSGPPSNAWLVAVSGPAKGRRFGLQKGRNTIGRDPSRCEILIEDPAVSAQHACLTFQNGRFVIHDLASLNGTFVNDQRVDRQLLLDGDKVKVGNSLFIYKQA
jgi:hypothetical protein